MSSKHPERSESEPLEPIDSGSSDGQSTMQPEDQLIDGSIRTELRRIERARELDLDVSASWAEIFDYLDNQERTAVASSLGLSQSSTWRNILTAAIGVRVTASEEEIISRVKEIQRGDYLPSNDKRPK